MSGRDLDAAGIRRPALRRSYEFCRRLHARHGRTFYLATVLLPREKRPYVHALYGFARFADDIVDETVDDPDSTLTPAEKSARLDELGRRLVAGPADNADDPVLPALRDTIDRWAIPLGYFEAFLDSMRMDLTVGEYKTYDELMGYMAGSAAAIGLQMVPILEHPAVPREVVEPYARDLGVACQLANFIRDVGEDLRRGRIYLPLEDLALFGVDRDRLAARVVDGPVRRLLAYEIARTRETFRTAWPGIRLLHPASRDCIRVAHRLYAGILDEVERADYQVFDRRAAVRLRRRATVAVPGLARALAARRRGLTGRSRGGRATPSSTG